MKKNIIKRIFADYIEIIGKRKTIFFFCLAIIVSILAVIEPLFFAKIIEQLEKFYKIWKFDFEELYKLIGIWIAFITTSIIITYYYTLKVAEQSSLDFLTWKFKRNIDKMLYIKYWTAISKEQWKLAKNFDRWIDAFFMVIYNFAKIILVPFIQILAIFIIMLFVNIKMAVISLFVLPLLIYVWYFFKNKTVKLQNNLDKNWEDIFWKVWDILTNIWLVKFLWVENKFKNILIKKYSQTEEIQKKIQVRWAIWNIITQICIMIARLLVLWFWVYFIVIWEITLSVLFLFFSYVWFIYYPVWFIFSNLKILQENITKIERFYNEVEVLEQDIEEENNKKLKIFENISWKIEFKDIKFWYSEDKIIFNNLNFSINSWEKIAFVWNTWSWKSTIINLLFRLWDSESWKILLDWKDIYDYSKKSLRENIWIVSQDNSLFNTTVRQNLEYALKEWTKKENEKKINEALKKAHADFIFDLKDWIDTIIWERWLKLSWWEKQRLSIARLFLKNPKILILDEATSALDNKTEKFIQESLDELMKWKTSIIIAHRLSTIQNVDKIFMLEKWKIVESWNYEELISKKAKFYELANPDNLILK